PSSAWPSPSRPTARARPTRSPATNYARSSPSEEQRTPILGLVCQRRKATANTALKRAVPRRWTARLVVVTAGSSVSHNHSSGGNVERRSRRARDEVAPVVAAVGSDSDEGTVIP